MIYALFAITLMRSRIADATRLALAGEIGGGGCAFGRKSFKEGFDSPGTRFESFAPRRHFPVFRGAEGRHAPLHARSEGRG
jgi:hypothetical protein